MGPSFKSSILTTANPFLPYQQSTFPILVFFELLIIESLSIERCLSELIPTNLFLNTPVCFVLMVSSWPR